MERESAGRQPRSAGKWRDRFIKVMADYFNIPMGVCAPFVVSCQFNNPRPGDPFLAQERHYFGTGCSLCSLLDTYRRRIDLPIYDKKCRTCDRQKLATSRREIRPHFSRGFAFASRA